MSASSEDMPRQKRTHADLDRELEEMLVEAEQTVARLKAELVARRAQRDDLAAGDPTDLDRDARAAAQHAEIERLEQHLAASRVRWSEVRAFFEDALREMLGTNQDDEAQADARGADSREGRDD